MNHMVRTSLAKWRRGYASLRNRARRGLAAIEFALTMPIWMALILGTADGSYFLLVNERCDRIAYSVTDIVTQYQTISLANLSDIVKAASQLMQPISFGANGIVIVTSVFQPSTGAPVVEWQYTGGGSLTKTSQIGTTGGSATLPNGLTLNTNDNVIISEVYYDFTPLFVNNGYFGTSTIYRVAIYKPRLSPLVTPPS